jgi:hypothetical protein
MGWTGHETNRNAKNTNKIWQEQVNKTSHKRGEKCGRRLRRMNCGQTEKGHNAINSRWIDHSLPNIALPNSMRLYFRVAYYNLRQRPT